MRATGRDIVELFGYSPDDISKSAVKALKEAKCPFTKEQCTKTNHDKSIIYGVCSVTKGVKKKAGSEVIICPNRIYAGEYQVLTDAAKIVWGQPGASVVVGGTIAELQAKAKAVKSPVVAFGKNSGKEIQISVNGQLSMDWILQRYENVGGLEPKGYIGIEVQSIDITQNYRDNWAAYDSIRRGQHISAIPNSNHGLNWANVHKRLIPQIIRKGNVYSMSKKCAGFFFILPDVVFEKFEAILGKLATVNSPARDVLSVLTYALGPEQGQGHIRALNRVRVVHYKLIDIKEAFGHRSVGNAPEQLEKALADVFS